MPEFHDLLTDEAIAAGASASGTHPVESPSSGRNWTYYVAADADGTNLAFTWEIRPPDDTEFYEVVDESRTGVDASGNVGLEIPVGVAVEIRLTVTNNAAAASTVSASAGAARQ